MTYDLVIRNGTIIDGTGAPRFHADVAVQDGKIVEIGTVIGSAKRELDATDLIVAPGFVDPHSHYDAQICWDTELSPSSWHGTTTVVMGNCGVGVAPCKPAAHDINTQDLVAVEGIPYEALEKGISWDWTTFPEYMDAAAKRGCSINMAFLAPLTPFRHFVMGEDSMERAATPEETQEIKALLKEAVAAGAVGFSFTTMKQHIGYAGKALACRLASEDEFKAYANALRELGKGSIEIALTEQTGVLSDKEYDFLEMLLDESQRPITWIALMDRDDLPTACQDSLKKSVPLRKRGAIPQVSAVTVNRDVSIQRPFVFASCPTWHPVFNKAKEAQAAYFRDPAFRQSFREDLKTPRTFSGNWARIRLTHVSNPALQELVGLTIEDIAHRRGVDGVDALLDVVLEDDLNTEFSLAYFNATDERIPPLLNEPMTLIGLADGGAHVDTTCDVRYTTYLLGTWVRERKIMSLEKAVQRITSEPADFFGIAGRGRLKVGNAADIVLFDPETIGCATKWEAKYDLPGGAKRLVSASKGVEFTVVNGVVAWEQNKVTAARAGQVIRS